MKNSFKIYTMILTYFLFFHAPAAILANTPPEIMPIPVSQQAVEDSEYTLEITVKDDDLPGNGDKLSFMIYDPPAWLKTEPEITSPAANQISAKFTGTPTDEIPNTYTIIIEVTDSQNNKATSDFIYINVQNVNDQPKISGTLPTSAIQTLQFSFKPVIDDPDTKPSDMELAWTTDTAPKPLWLNILPLYKLTDSSISALAETSVPASIIDSITSIKNIEFIDETGLIEALNNKIGAENTESYKTVIISNAYLSGWAIAGTPANTDVGIVENIVISVSDKLDDNGISDTVIDASLPGFDLCVINSNDPPEFQMDDPPDAEIFQGGTFSLSLSATDPDIELLGSVPSSYWDYILGKCGPDSEIKDSLIWNPDNPPYVLINGPEWLQISGIPGNEGATVANMSGHPNNDDVGTYNDIEIIVKDGQGEIGRLKKFSIIVNNVNDDPFFTKTPTPNVEINEDQEITFKYTPDAIIKTNIVKADDFDLKHGDQLNFSLDPATKPVWLNITKVSDTEAKLTGVPANKDVGIYSGITLIVKDSAGATATFPFNLQVNNVNDPPEFIQTPANEPANPVTINEGASFKMLSPEVIAVAQDIDKDESITFRIITTPAAKWLSVSTGTEIISGITTATASFDGIPGNADVGTYQVNVIAEDNSNTEVSTTFYVKVNNVNTGPRIVTVLPTTLTAYEDKAFSQTIIVEDEDIPHDDKLTVSLVNKPSWLSYSIDTDQNTILRGTPRAVDAGVYKGITLTVKDKEGESDYISFNIEVKAVNDAPVISGKIPPAILGRNYSFLPEASDEEGDKLIFNITFITDEADWLKINPLTGELSGVPTEIMGYFISINVSDGNNGYSKLGPLLLNVITGPGDIDGSSLVDLKDAIIALQIVSGIPLSISPGIDADVNEDGVFGLEEAIYILNSIAAD